MGPEDQDTDDIDEEAMENVEAAIEDLESEFEDELDGTDLTESFEQVGRNVEESSDELNQLIEDFQEGNIQNKRDLLSHLIDISNSTATTGGVIAGALAGSLAGPIGSIAGGLVGGTSVYFFTQDGKRLLAVPVDESDIPDGGLVHEIDELDDLPDVRDLVEEVATSGEPSQEASNLFRQIDFEEVRTELDDLGRTGSDDLSKYAGYFFEHQGQRVVVMIDEDT